MSVAAAAGSPWAGRSAPACTPTSAVRAEEVDFFGYKSPAPADYLAASGFTSLFSIRAQPAVRQPQQSVHGHQGPVREVSAEQGFGSFTWTKFDAEGRDCMFPPSAGRTAPASSSSRSAANSGSRPNRRRSTSVFRG